MNDNMKEIICNIVDLSRLNDRHFQFIETLNDSDKLLVIKTYMETMNQIITFIEDFL